MNCVLDFAMSVLLYAPQQQVAPVSAARLGGAEPAEAQIMTNPTNETINSILKQGPKLMLESMRSASDRNEAYLMVHTAKARAFSPGALSIQGEPAGAESLVIALSPQPPVGETDRREAL